MKELQTASEEFLNLKARFNLTLPSAKIVKIERIQNRKLWKVFQNEIEDISDKIGSKAPVQLLFHGTSGTDPKFIYTGEEGFDMRYSN